MPKIVHLTTVHPADDSRILHKECRTIAAAGYDVMLIAPEKEGQGGLGIEYRALPLVRSRFVRIVVSTFRALRIALSLRADLYHLHDPELLPVALVLRAVGRRVVYDAHEDLPEQILAKPWIAPAVRRPLAWSVALMQWLVSRTLSAIVAATPAIAERFPPSRTICVQNFPMTEEFSIARPTPYHERPLTLAYVGRVDRVRGAREMALAMQLLGASSSARLCVAGNVSDAALQAELDALPARDRVDYLGWLGRSDVASLLSRVRLGLVVLHPVPNYLQSYPVKLFEYMAAGVPVIASNFPLWRSIVEDAGCGLLVDPLDASAIARAIRRLLEDPSEAAAMGERGRQAIRAHYSWKPQGEKLLALYSRLVGEVLAPNAAARAATNAMPIMKA